MTHADWFAQHNGGGWRTARKPRRCQQFGCYEVIRTGEKYFDTSKTTEWPKTFCICAACANKPVRENHVAHS